MFNVGFLQVASAYEDNEDFRTLNFSSGTPFSFATGLGDDDQPSMSRKPFENPSSPAFQQHPLRILRDASQMSARLHQAGQEEWTLTGSAFSPVDLRSFKDSRVQRLGV